MTPRNPGFNTSGPTLPTTLLYLYNVFNNARIFKIVTLEMSNTHCCIAIPGRLGNHLFQLAALLHEHVVHGKSMSILAGPMVNYYRHFLHKFAPFIVSRLPTVASFAIHDAPVVRYVPIPAEAQLLRGYFQSGKYFVDIRKEVLEWFDPPASIKDTVARKYTTLLTPTIQTNAVVIHVRRGDYAKAGPSMYGILTPAYFNKAMAHMRELVGPGVQFLIFSDDVRYCRATFQGANITCVDEPNEHLTLHLMSQFKFYIISNSTFSWWAAYLGEPAQTVIAPDPWYGPAGPQDFEDIYEPGWIRMNAE